MAGGRKGLVAPQNTFLENIVRRSNGKRSVRIRYPGVLSVPFIADASGRSAPADAAEPGALPGVAARAPGAASWRLGKVGRAGRV